MPKKVNFAADIFYLHAQVGALIRNLALAVDPDLFAEYIDREIHFAATTAGRIFRALKESSFRQERLQVLIDLRSLAVLILDLLEMVLAGRSAVSAFLADQVPRYQRMRETLREMERELDYQVAETSRGREESGPVVSEEELMHLLAEGE
jgi:hypothetical protein